MRVGVVALGVLLALPSARVLAAPGGDQSDKAADDNSKPILSAPAREYSRKQLGIEAFFPKDADEKTASPLLWQTYEGHGHNLLDPDDFYRKVGREDLAASYRHWTVLKPLLVIGGLGAMVGALFVLKYRPAAYALVGGGLTMFIIGYAADPQPIGWKEASALADAHNEALSNRLGLHSLSVEGDGSAQPDVSAEALAAYEQSYIDFDVHMTFQNGTPDRSSRRWLPFQGKDHKTLDHPSFYRLMGRDDLASAYSRNQGVQIGFLVGGLGAGVGGVAILYSAAQSHDHTTAYTGLGVMAAGAVLFMIAWNYTVDPISEAEARELADDYNRNVLRRAGVPIADDDDSDAAPQPTPPTPFTRPAPPAPRKSWAFAFPAQGGGGLGIAGTF
jgi:hypothetical protein